MKLIIWTTIIDVKLKKWKRLDQPYQNFIENWVKKGFTWGELPKQSGKWELYSWFPAYETYLREQTPIDY